MSKSRSKARHCAVQALYQWQLTGQSTREIHDQFMVEANMARVDTEYFKTLLSGVVEHLAAIDARLQPFLDRPIAEVDMVERAVLRLGACELMFHPEVPYRVVINEALEATKTFGAEQGFRYVNGVLDQLARQVRQAEVERAAQRRS